MPDCGDNSCLYAPRPKRGMRTNGGCRCDDCPTCGAVIRPLGDRWRHHYDWCYRKTWAPEHHPARAKELKELKGGAK